MKITKIIPFLLVIISFIVAFIISPHMPYMMASHWGISGQVDGYMSKVSGLYFLPVLMLLMYVLLRFLPTFDPYRHNFSQFEKHYDNFMIVLFCFMLYIYGLTLVWNLGYRFNMIQFLVPALSTLFFFTGHLIANTKMNWFVGIRTPWTMNNPKVWQKTHAIGGKLFKLVGLISLIGVLLPDFAFYLLLIPLLFTVVFVFVYSYVLYSRYNQA